MQFFQWLTVNKFELTVRGKQTETRRPVRCSAGRVALSAESYLKELMVSSEANEDATDDSGLNF